MTLGTMITNALRRANVIRSNTSANAEQKRDAIRRYNGLMSKYDADGVDLGDFPVTLVGDTLDLEREHEDPVETIFALNLQIFHGLPLEEGLVAEAQIADKFLLRNTACKPDVNLNFAPLGRASGSTYNINNG